MPLLRASGADGLVVNVSSVSAFTGLGSNIAYCASKAALDTMTVSLARAFGPAVRFSACRPASVDTDFIQGPQPRRAGGEGCQATPLGRVVTPEDVALSPCWPA
jgi:3-oxoacyl-[acyl-carrier protein] reductase